MQEYKICADPPFLAMNVRRMWICDFYDDKRSFGVSALLTFSPRPSSHGLRCRIVCMMTMLRRFGTNGRASNFRRCSLYVLPQDPWPFIEYSSSAVVIVIEFITTCWPPPIPQLYKFHAVHAEHFKHSVQTAPSFPHLCSSTSIDDVRY